MSEKKRIAVVDDDSSILSLYEAILIESYDLSLFLKPTDFLNHVKNESPHLLIVDLLMPETDGLTLVREVKKIREIPIIAVSGSRDSQITAGALYETSAFISKPFDNLGLIQVIEDCLGTDSI